MRSAMRVTRGSCVASKTAVFIRNQLASVSRDRDGNDIPDECQLPALLDWKDTDPAEHWMADGQKVGGEQIADTRPTETCKSM